MAENAMQGIMGLENAPQMANQAPPMGAPPIPEVTRDQFLAFEQARQEMSPGDIANDLLQAGEEIDPAAVQELRRDLADLDLPLELILAMLTMMEGLLAEPGNYAQYRQELLAEGVPEDLLPEQFDGEFFGAMELALEQMVNMQSPTPTASPQGFAEGGLASLRPIAQELQNYGRNGDTMLAHITPSEARMLQRLGGSGTINPVTGLREYFLGGVIKGVGKAFKSVGKAVGSAVKGVVKGVTKFVKSPVGKIVTAAALAFFIGPMAATALGGGLTAAGATTLAGAVTSTVGTAAISGAIGGFGASVLAGDNLKTSLRNGAIGGVVAGAGAGVMGGAEAFAPGSYGGPTTISGQWESLKSGVSNTFGGTSSGAEALPVEVSGNVASTSLSSTPTTPSVAPVSAPAAPGAPTVGGLNVPVPSAPPAPATGSLNVPVPSAPSAVTQTAQPGFFDLLGQGEYSEAFSSLIPGSGPSVDPTQVALEAVQKLPAGTSEAIQASVYETALKKASPGILSKYGPYAAAGLGVMSLTGGFDEQDTTPEISEYDRLRAEVRPEDYEINLGGVETTYNTPMGTDSQTYTPYQDFYASMAQNPYAPQNPQAQTFQPQQPYAPNTMLMAQGGSANTKDFPRKTGPINGPGTEKSDSIPAMLSDGEFVYTAKAVRGAGNGSRRAGAKRMYQMMKEFERNA